MFCILLALSSYMTIEPALVPTAIRLVAVQWDTWHGYHVIPTMLLLVRITWLNVWMGGNTSDSGLCLRWLWSTQWRTISTTSVKRSRMSDRAESVAISCSTTWSTSALLLVRTCICRLTFNVCALVARVLYLAISLATLVMKTPGLALAIAARACLAVLQQSATTWNRYNKKTSGGWAVPSSS